MSFVITVPEIMTAAAGNLTEIGSTLGEATATGAGATTSITSAAADDLSIELSNLFGTYGRHFHALRAQAAAFHHELVSLMNGRATAYLDTELASARQGLVNAVNAPALTGASIAGAGFSAAWGRSPAAET